MAKQTTQDLTAELIPKQGDRRVGHKVYEILEEVLRDKDQLGLPAKWTYHYRLKKNKHWKHDSKKASLISANMLFSHRQRTVNMLTDNAPTFNVSRMGSGEIDEEIFDKYLHTAEHWWHDQEQQDVLESSVDNGEVYGCTIEKVRFDPEAESRLGEVVTDTVDPFRFGFYPVDTLKLQDAIAVLHFEPKLTWELRRRHPDKAEDIVADSEFLKELGDERREIKAGKGSSTRWTTTFANTVKVMLGNEIGSSGQISDRTFVVECWVKDRSTDETGQPKYPGHIRFIKACVGGDVVLEDKPNPSINPNLDVEKASKTYLWDHFPFSLTVSIKDTSNPWGMSDYEQLEGLQVEVNKTLTQINLFKDKASRLKFINPQDSGVENQELTNYPGIIRPVSAMVAAALRYIDPPKMPIDMYKALDLYKDFFFLVSGTFELESAQTPGREVIAYKAIAALLERATTMMRGKIRNYSRMIRERGRMYISHAQNWYTEERWITYQQEGEENSIAIKGEELIIPAKLAVVSGSTMPVSRVQEREQAIALHKQGAIPVDELLKKLDWPDWRNVVKRMQAGPLGKLMERMGQLGTPPQALEFMQGLMEMDDKEFERELEQGKLPAFQQIAAPQEEQGPSEAETLMQDIEMQIKVGEAEKLKVETELIQEKINTERVEQEVKLAGVTLDRESMKLKRAEFVENIEDRRDKGNLERARFVDQIDRARTAQGPYREKGMKSNNRTVQ